VVFMYNASRKESVMKQHLMITISIVLMTAISQIVHSAVSMAFMDFYTNPDYFQVWSKVMMPYAGPPPITFYYWAIGLGIFTWSLFAISFLLIKKNLPGNSVLKKGLFFGLIAFMISGLSGGLSYFLYINIPIPLILIWSLEGLSTFLINGVIAASIIRE